MAFSLHNPISMCRIKAGPCLFITFLLGLFVTLALVVTPKPCDSTCVSYEKIFLFGIVPGFIVLCVCRMGIRTYLENKLLLTKIGYDRVQHRALTDPPRCNQTGQWRGYTQPAGIDNAHRDEQWTKIEFVQSTSYAGLWRVEGCGQDNTTGFELRGMLNPHNGRMMLIRTSSASNNSPIYYIGDWNQSQQVFAGWREYRDGSNIGTFEMRPVSVNDPTPAVMDVEHRNQLLDLQASAYVDARSKQVLHESANNQSGVVETTDALVVPARLL